MADLTYHESQNIKYIQKLRELMNELPSFTELYFRGIEHKNAPRTRIAYAMDLKTFFEFMKESNPSITCDIKDIPIDILNKITTQDIEEYLEHIKLYKKDDKQMINNERAIKRKLCALRSFYGYFHKNKMIDVNPTLQVDMPKLHEKAIVRLDNDEVSDLLNTVESGEGLTKKQLDFHKKTKQRDLALLTLLLGTGIRVSECVGLDINDVDMKNERIKVVRKGGYESYVYFGDEVSTELELYLEERRNIEALEGSENALFLSITKARLGVRAVEKLVKKYSSLVISLKKITPHKLRSTYGTSLYKETGDIYLVADVLGHKDVNTTKKHYAAIEDEHRRKARNIVKLRNSYSSENDIVRHVELNNINTDNVNNTNVNNTNVNNTNANNTNANNTNANNTNVNNTNANNTNVNNTNTYNTNNTN